MTTFADRNNFAPPLKPVENEAPLHLRYAYIKILNPYLIDGRKEGQDEWEASYQGPFNADYVLAEICDRLNLDSVNPQTAEIDPHTTLMTIVKQVPWYQFYSIVEIEADLIQDYFDRLKERAEDLTFEASLPFADIADIYEEDPVLLDFLLDPSIELLKPPETYKQTIDDVFESKGIVWRFNGKDHLTKMIPSEINEIIERVEEALAGKFEPALLHYRKAQTFLFTPGALDPENAVKEVITALESAGCTIFQINVPFGGIIKKMETTQLYDPLIIEYYRRLWNFSNQKSGIRHGKEEQPNLTPAEAELCFHIGGALLYYMLSNQGYIYR